MNFLNRLLKKKAVEIEIDKRNLISFLPSHPVILEAGVYDGRDTEEFAKILPQANIYGFECLPYYYEVATKRLEAYPNVSLYPIALSDKSEVLDFYVSTRQGEMTASSSILKPRLHTKVHPEVKFESRIKVQAVSVDDWADKCQIGKIDFMWLDLQGAELRVLKGANKSLVEVKAIFTEVSLIETYEAVPLYRDLKSFLLTKGFEVEREYLPYDDMGNVFFVKR
jgi:FkbM family methyltransferase